MIILSTIIAAAAYAIIAIILTFVAVIALEPIAHFCSWIVSRPIAEQRRMEPADRDLYYFTGKNFFLMLFVIALYFILAWIIVSHFAVWSIAIYLLAALFTLNYWVNVAGKLPSWTDRG
jgi:hypothetical protein